MNKLELLKSQIEVKSQELSDLVANSDSVEEIKSATTELNGLKSEYSALLEAKAAITPVKVPAMTTMLLDGYDKKAVDLLEGKSITMSISEIAPDLELKTLMSTTSGFGAPKDTTGLVFRGSNPGSALFDALPKFRLDSVSQLYYVGATRTNNAAANLEGTAPTDNVLTYTETVVTARPVTSWIPVSEAVIRSLQSNNLNMIMEDVMQQNKERIDAEILSGTAISRSLNSLVGVANTGSCTSLGFASGTVYDYRSSIDYAAAYIESVGDRPQYLVVNPLDRSKIINQRIGGTVNAFAWGTQSDYNTYNGLQMISDSNQAAGTAWILGSQAARIGMLDDITVELGYDGSDWTKGQRSLRSLVHIGLLSRPLSIYKLSLS